MILEPHEFAVLNPQDPTQVESVKPRIPYKNNSVLVRRAAHQSQLIGVR